MEKAVDQRADEIIPTDQKLAVAERRALALVAICQDSLYQTGSSEESGPVDVAVIVDTRVAGKTNGETGVRVLAGPRIGPGALEEILCQGRIGPGRDRRERQTLGSGTTLPHRGPETASSCPPPRWWMHRGRLYQQIPARSPPCPTWSHGGPHRHRQSDQPLLVSPSCLSPSGRSPHPPDRDQSDPTETTPIGASFPRPAITSSSLIVHFAETFGHSRKRMTAWSCQGQRVGLRFHARRRGNPAAARIERCGEVRAAPRLRFENLEPPGNRGSQGRAGDRTGILRDRRAVTERRVSRLARSSRRRGGRDLRIAHLPTASAIGKNSIRSWVPGPTSNGRESREG